MERVPYHYATQSQLRVKIKYAEFYKDRLPGEGMDWVENVMVLGFNQGRWKQRLGIDSLW